MKRKRCPQEKSITCQLQEVIEMLEDPEEIVSVNEKDDEDAREREEQIVEGEEELVENYKANYQIPKFIGYSFKVQNESNLVQRELYNREKQLQTLGLDIAKVIKYVQLWELEYQQVDFSFNWVKYFHWHVALDEIPPEVPTIPTQALQEMVFNLK
jgi:hypothetical protein